MKKVITAIAFFYIVIFANGQIVAYPNRLLIYFSFPEKKIIDTNAVFLKIRYQNDESDTVSVFKDLIDGSWRSPYSNIYIQIQILNNGIYKNIIDKSYDYFYGDSVLSFPYYKLPPGKSYEAIFNIFDKMPYFDKAKYRLCIYLVKIPYDRNVPYVIEYIKSRWFYFEVTKKLLRK